MLPQVGIDGSWRYLTAWKKGDAIASTADAQLILVLDEATSHLDVINESLINAEIKKMQITRVIVAHRPEIIRSANRVILLQNGQATGLQPDPFSHQA